jgi:hypothetical protein
MYLEKKLDLRGVLPPSRYCLRRKPSHIGRENSRTPIPPIHIGIAAHVRLSCP